MPLIKLILRFPFLLLRNGFRLLQILFAILGSALKPVIGSWNKPRWWSAFLRWVTGAFNTLENSTQTHAKAVSALFALLLCVAIGGYYGWQWWLNRPQPINPAPLVFQQTEVTLTPPRAIDYSAAKIVPQRIVLSFDNSAAPLTNIHKEVHGGIELSPAVTGKWTWESDSQLVFTPNAPLPMGEKYQLTLDPKVLLAPQIKINKRKYNFDTPAFDYVVGQTEFYQDPQNRQKKSAVFNIKFNAPVDVASFEKKLSLLQVENKNKNPQKLNFSVVYDDKKLNAWIHSEPIKMLDTGGTVSLTINKGVQTSVPAQPADTTKSGDVSVPGLYTLNLENISTQIVDNENLQDQRVLFMTFSDAIRDKELNRSVKAWLLPSNNPNEPNGGFKNKNGVYPWDEDSEIDSNTIARAQSQSLALNEGETEYQTQFSFRFNAPAHRFLLLEISRDITSVGGYKLPEKIWRVVEVPDYPKLLKFTSQGALLSVKGDKKISVAARNVPGLHVDIKRVIPDQLQHIVSFKSGTFASAEFNRLNDEYFTEHFQYQTAINYDTPGAINYQGVDLSRYLSTNASAHRGIFLLSLSQWDPNKKHPSQDEDSQDENSDDISDSSDDDTQQIGDSRFIVVTDLGIIAKRAQDDTRDVFVQSINSGMPVDQARVSVIAKNGVTLLSQTTDVSGHVRFPALDGYTHERTPVMYLVEKEGDASFLPIGDNNDRELDLSRFDITGEETPTDPRTLRTYLFSDRGVYRPGDKFNIGLITRAADWQVGIAGVPVRAEIRDPRDKVMATIPLTLDASGFNELNYTTEENSPTGEWQIYLYLLGKNNENATLLGNTSVWVKEFEPDQLKVALNLTPDHGQGWVKPSELKATIDVQNLFGTPSQKSRVSSKLTLRPTYPNFAQYPDYAFYESRANNNGFDSALEDKTTDENGQAEIPLNLKDWGDSTYQLQLLSEAFVSGGGRSVAATARTLVSPYDYLVGVKADGDLEYINLNTPRSLHLIAIDPSLRQIAVTGLKQVLHEQKYISVLTKQDSGMYKYESKLKETQIDEQPLNLTEKGASLPLATNKPGTYVLSIENAQGKELNRIAYNVVGDANVTRSLDRNAELKLKLNQKVYNPGDEIEVSINAPYTGSGLITIEKDRVYSWQWFHTDTTSSVQKIRIPAEMEGNGYINVQFVRDINSDEIFMSPLSYGVVPFNISTHAHQNNLEVTAPKIIKPGEKLTMTVKTDSPQKVVLFAVDEGILQVARYRLKDPLDWFFRKRELSVTSSQILDLILPEFSKLMGQSAAPGGDGGASLDLNLNPFKRKRDKPVVWWSGITEVNGEKQFSYTVPDYFNGKIRIMSVSVTPDKIGTTQTATTVRDNFIMTPNVPNMVAPGDEFDVSVGVSNNLPTADGKPVDIQLGVTPPPQLEVMGSTVQSLKLAEKHEGVVTFRLRAKALPGDAPLVFEARVGDKVSRRTLSTSVRPATPWRIQSVMGRMSGSSQNVDNLRQMFDNYAQRKAALSHSPLVLTDGLAQYLSDYPYYCSEQIVSRSVPLLLSRYPELRGSLNTAQANKQMQTMLGILRSRQNDSGAFGLWRATTQPDPFVTPWVVQFLLEARDAGYPLPPGMLEDANSALREIANTPYNDMYHLRLSSWSIYLLTSQGVITTNALASVQDRLQSLYPNSWQNDLSALYLASAYRQLKMDDEANALLQPIWKNLSKARSEGWWTDNYFDPLANDAMRLYLITKYFPEKTADIPLQLLENMVKSLKDQRNTTFSSAVSILALTRYSSQVAASDMPDKTLAILLSSKNGDSTPRVISSQNGLFAQAQFGADASAIHFENKSDKPAWYVVTQAGYDVSAPDKPISRGLEITRDYTDEQGKPVTRVVVGQKINVHLKIRANSVQGQNNVAIVDLLPGGFEVVQQSPPKPADADDSESGNTDTESDNTAGWQSPLAVEGSSWLPDYSDIREDRVIIYGNVTTDAKELVYQIKATNTGTFTVPPAFGEAMYDREVQALSAGGGKLQVVDH